MSTHKTLSNTTPIPSTRRLARAGCIAILLTICGAKAADVTATWATGTSGAWNVNSNWTNTPAVGGFPNNGNGGVATYDAVINAAGPAYTVTLNTGITVEDLLVNSANATVNHTAGVFRATGALTLSAGTYRLSGGRISNTNIVLNGGNFAFTSSGGILSNGATLNGNLNLSTGGASVRLQSNAGFTGVANLSGSNSLLNYEDTRTLTGKTINLDGINARLGISGNNTLTLGAGTMVRGTGENSFGFVGSGTGAVVNQAGVMRADLAGQTLTVRPTSFSNLAGGTASAINGSVLSISATNWNNAGQIFATGGSTVIFDGTWSNTGGRVTVDATSTLGLGGVSTIGGLGTIDNRVGGRVSIIGTINNTGTTLALDATTGSWTLLGGRIIGGNITQSGGATLRFTNSSGILSDGAMLHGDLNITDILASVRLQSGADFTGGANLGHGTSIYFEDTRTLTGKTIAMQLAGKLGISGNNVLTLGAGTMIRGDGRIESGIFVSGTGAVVNQAGTIRADELGGSLLVRPTSFTNMAGGTASAINGGTLTISATNWINTGLIKATGGSGLSFGGAYTNSGTIVATDSSVSFGGTWSNVGTITTTNSIVNISDDFTIGSLGTFNRTGGTVFIYGNLQNVGTTLALDATTGSWNLSRGRIVGGNITESGGARLIFDGGILSDGAVFHGDVNLSFGDELRLQSGADFTGVANLGGAGSFPNILSFEESRTVSGKTISLGGSYAWLGIAGENTLTLGAGTLVRGTGSIRSGLYIGGTGAVVNRAGTIRADIAGQTLTVEPTSFSNQDGVVEAINGSTLSVPNGYTQTAGTTRVANGSTISVDAGNTIAIDGGRLEGAGIIAANVSNAGTIAPGLSAGALTISGDLTLRPTSVLQIELGGRTSATQYDLLTEGGTVPLSLAGALDVSFISGFQNFVLPTDVFTFLQSNQSIAGTFANLSGGRVATSDGTGSFAVTVVGNSVQLGSFAPVPEPSTVALLALGSLLCGSRRRRRAHLSHSCSRNPNRSSED